MARSSSRLQQVVVRPAVMAVLIALFAAQGIFPLVSYAGIRATVSPWEVPPKHLYVLSVGINQYAKESQIPSIAFGEADAISVANVFSGRLQSESLMPGTLSSMQMGGTTPSAAVPTLPMAFPEVTTRTLLGRDASLEGIRGAFQEIAHQATSGDAFLFYFGGMVTCKAGWATFSFFPSDAKFKSGDTLENSLSAAGLATLLLQIPATRQIIILDTCDSRNAVNAIRAAMEPKDSFDLASQERRVAILSVDGQSFESEKLGHGLLSYCLLRGMTGEADVDHSGFITLNKLLGYMTWKVLQVAWYSGFDIARVKNVGVPPEAFYFYSTLTDLALSAPEKKPPAAPSPPTRSPTVVEAEAPPKVDVGTDYAIIVATDHYSPGWNTLNNPVFDGKALSDELVRDYGFDRSHITELYDKKKVDLLQAVNAFNKRSNFGPHDRLLVYIAGHGFRDANDGWIAFADSSAPEPDADYESSKMMGFARLRGALEASSIPHVLLILDVCYGGTFAARGGFQGILGGAGKSSLTREQLINRMMEARSRIYLTSGDEKHPVSDGAPGEHSPFSRALLDELAARGGLKQLLDIATLYQHLRGEVPLEPYAGYFDRSGDDQKADFVLIPSEKTASGTAATGR